MQTECDGMPRDASEVFLRNGKGQRLKIAECNGGIARINSTLEFNLINEIRRFIEGSSLDDIQVSVHLGERASTTYCDVKGLDGYDVARAQRAMGRIECALEILMSCDMPGWVEPEKMMEAKMAIIEVLDACKKKSSEILKGIPDD